MKYLRERRHKRLFEAAVLHEKASVSHMAAAYVCDYHMGLYPDRTANHHFVRELRDKSVSESRRCHAESAMFFAMAFQSTPLWYIIGEEIVDILREVYVKYREDTAWLRESWDTGCTSAQLGE